MRWVIVGLLVLDCVLSGLALLIVAAIANRVGVGPSKQPPPPTTAGDRAPQSPRQGPPGAASVSPPPGRDGAWPFSPRR